MKSKYLAYISFSSLLCFAGAYLKLVKIKLKIEVMTQRPNLKNLSGVSNFRRGLNMVGLT